MNEVQWELSQEFTFGSNADEVVTYILGSSNWKKDRMFVRDVEVRENKFILRLFLGVTTGVKAMYSIGLMGGTRVGADFYDEKAYSLLSATTDIGEIALIQVKPGECIAKLYLETNPRRLGSQHTSLWYMTPRLAAMYWNDLVNGWVSKVAVNSTEFGPFPKPSLIQLGLMIESSFNLQELVGLCDEFNINPENIPGTTLREKVRALVLFADRHGQVDELVRLCKKHRPIANWEQILKD